MSVCCSIYIFMSIFSADVCSIYQREGGNQFLTSVLKQVSNLSCFKLHLLNCNKKSATLTINLKNIGTGIAYDKGWRNYSVKSCVKDKHFLCCGFPRLKFAPQAFWTYFCASLIFEGSFSAHHPKCPPLIYTDRFEKVTLTLAIAGGPMGHLQLLIQKFYLLYVIGFTQKQWNCLVFKYLVIIPSVNLDILKAIIVGSWSDPVIILVFTSLK